MSKFLQYVESGDFLKFLTGVTILGCFWAVVISLIINPNSLNSEKNPIVGIMIGALLLRVGDMSLFYFSKKDGDKMPKDA
jgi:hypothetical protein